MAEFTDRLRPLLLGALLCGGGAMAATPLGVIEGTTGTVSFHGGLLSSPCSLTPDSRDQSVDLGDISARDFRNAGDRSAPVRFRLSFRNCLLGARARWRITRPARATATPAASTCRESRPPLWFFSAKAMSITHRC